MIDPISRTSEWVQKVAKENNVKDISLVEKSIRAFSLLESLVRSGCPLLFKGGTSLMLYFNSAKRLSIDIDIICPPGTKIEQYIDKYSEEYGFEKVELVDRISRIEVPKKHAKYFYKVSFSQSGEESTILLDVLFEESHYTNCIKKPITSPFLKIQGKEVEVIIPSKEDLLGDKLTAFAPHTTGIPFKKGARDCTMEICKQLFDIASLFDIIEDLTITKSTFNKFVEIELQYRNITDKDVNSVLDDIYSTSRCICLRGHENKEEFKMLESGITRIKSFIHGEKFTIDKAVLAASKVAYISILIKKGETKVKHFESTKIKELVDVKLTLHTKFNKLKKTNIEAFYYWYEIQKLIL